MFIRDILVNIVSAFLGVVGVVEVSQNSNMFQVSDQCVYKYAAVFRIPGACSVKLQQASDIVVQESSNSEFRPSRCDRYVNPRIII